MKELILEVQTSELMEYNRAAAKFGQANNSDHESYAVILEEFQEAQFQSDCFKDRFNRFWELVKANDKDALIPLTIAREFAEHAAAEWIQVAAMCYKATVKKEVPTC